MKVFNCSQPSQGPQAFEQQTSNSQAVGVSSRLSWRPKAAGEQGRQVDEDVIFVNLTSLLTPGGRYHQRRPSVSFTRVLIMKSVCCMLWNLCFTAKQAPSACLQPYRRSTASSGICTLTHRATDSMQEHETRLRGVLHTVARVPANLYRRWHVLHAALCL